MLARIPGRARRLRRSAVGYWMAVLVLALATGTTISRLIGEAEAQARRFGAVRRVPVAATPLEAGAVVAGADVDWLDLPVALLPDSPPARSPAGHAVVVPVVAGEVLVEAKLAPYGLRGATALLPRGRRAVTVPASPDARPPLSRGDRVDALATFDVEPTEAEGETLEPTFPVATAALVLDVRADAVTIAVTPAEAPRLAFAIVRGAVTLALTR